MDFLCRKVKLCGEEYTVGGMLVVFAGTLVALALFGWADAL